MLHVDFIFRFCFYFSAFAAEPHNKPWGMCQYHHHIHFLTEEVGAVREGLASLCTQFQSGNSSLKPQASHLQGPLALQPWSTSGVTRSRYCDGERMSRCPHLLPFPGRWTVEKVPRVVAGIEVAQSTTCQCRAQSGYPEDDSFLVLGLVLSEKST